jgi:hypothetical protein
MSDKVYAEVLDRTPNASIVQLPFRQFPGMVLQGDSLNILRKQIVEIHRLLTSEPNLDEAVDVCEGCIQILTGYLENYERVMWEHNLPLPYVKHSEQKPDED